MIKTEQPTENRLSEDMTYGVISSYSAIANPSATNNEVPNPPVQEARDVVTPSPPSVMTGRPIAAVLLAFTSALLFGTFAWIVGAGRAVVAVVALCAVAASVCLVYLSKDFSTRD